MIRGKRLPAAGGGWQRGHSARRLQGRRGDQMAAQAARGRHPFRHHHPERRTGRRDRNARQDLGREDRQVRGLAEICRRARRAVRPIAARMQQRVWPTIQADAWMLHAAGRTKMSPDEARNPEALTRMSQEWRAIGSRAIRATLNTGEPACNSWTTSRHRGSSSSPVSAGSRWALPSSTARGWTASRTSTSTPIPLPAWCPACSAR